MNSYCSQAGVRTMLGLLIAARILGIQLASGQSTAFTYQGHLADGALPARGLYDLRFVIYDAASGGGAVGGPLTNTMTIVTNGLFTVTLDFGASVFTGGERWLEIGVRTYSGGGAFTLLWPRQPITSTPYAIRAANFSGPVATTQLTGTISTNNIGAATINSTMLAAGAVGSDQLASGAVTTAALADGAVTADKMFTLANHLALTFTNPTPAVGDNFGFSVAAVGNDHVLVGTPSDNTGNTDAGAAYLFNTSGMLLTTFTNPTPFPGEVFGWSVTSVGPDKVLIGTPGHFDLNTGLSVGAAYLFSTNGALLVTLTNPTPAHSDEFGASVAAVGNDRLLIGAPFDDTGATNAGAAYLFSTNGALLTTFTNPVPASGDEFGSSLAALGNDRVLIGAHRGDIGATNAGAAYLFSTNGTLLTTFANPTPAFLDEFGIAVAAVGNDRVLIGAESDSTGATAAGSAYLFGTNGTLLTTFTNPTPAFVEHFASSVAAVGSDRVLIGARADNTGANGAGAVYLFTTNGTLLTTFTNPTPEMGDSFGKFVAVMGSDRVLIGADQDDTGATNAGAAYLFTLESYSPGVIADGVRSGSITTATLEQGAVTAAKLDPTIGVWTRSGNDVFRSAGNVGIGTTNPQTPLHIASDAQAVMALQDTGPDSTQSGYVTFRNSSFTETAWVGYGTPGDPDFSIVNTRGDIVLLPLGGGKVGIGTGSPGFTLEVAGSAGKPGGGSWSVASDARLKKNIRPLAGALDKLLALHGVNFEYIDPDKVHELSGERMGLLAQEVEKVFPDWVEAGPDGYKRVTVRGLEALVVEALRELQQKQDATLAEALKRCEAENADLKRRLEKLEELFGGRSNGGAK